MTLAGSLTGRTFPTTSPYLVTEERLAEFAAATGATFDGRTAPPTFPVVVAFRAMNELLETPGLGLALHRVVHGEQRFSCARPVVTGDVLTATLTVVSVRSMGGADIITTSTDLRDGSGEHVVTAHAVLVHRDEP